MYYLEAYSSEGAIRPAPLAFVAAEDLAQVIYCLHHTINYFWTHMFMLVVKVLHRCKKILPAAAFSLQPPACKVTGILNTNICPRSSRLMLVFWMLNGVKHSSNSIYPLQ